MEQRTEEPAFREPQQEHRRKPEQQRRVPSCQHGPRPESSRPRARGVRKGRPGPVMTSAPRLGKSVRCTGGVRPGPAWPAGAAILFARDVVPRGLSGQRRPSRIEPQVTVRRRRALARRLHHVEPQPQPLRAPCTRASGPAPTHRRRRTGSNAPAAVIIQLKLRFRPWHPASIGRPPRRGRKEAGAGSTATRTPPVVLFRPMEGLEPQIRGATAHRPGAGHARRARAPGAPPASRSQ